MNAALKAISYALPDLKLTSAELSSRFGEEIVKKIETVSGIYERTIARAEVCSSDLACAAAETMIEKFGIDKDGIDLLVFATQTPDYILPSTSCILQERLKLPRKCAAFDMNLGCTQFTYALCAACAWIKAGFAKNALVLSGETPSKLVNPLDKSAASIFSDGGAAAFLSESEESAISDAVFGTDGRGYKDLIVPAGGFRHPAKPEDDIPFDDGMGNTRTNKNLFIDGFRIFAFAYKALADSVGELLKRNALKNSDIDLFIFHQAGEKIIYSAADRLGIPREKVHLCLNKTGNCGGSSVAVALADAAMKGKLKDGMKIVLASFGVGLSWNAVLLNWREKPFLGACKAPDVSEAWRG